MNALLSDQDGLTKSDIANIQSLYGTPHDHSSDTQIVHLDTGSNSEWLNHDNLIDVVASTYQFFTGSVPSVEGFEFLIHSEANENDLTDTYYSEFNTENLFFNFAANLASQPDAKEAFLVEYAGLEFGAFIEAVYEEVIGFADAQTAGIDADGAVQFFENSQAYYEQIAAERGLSNGFDGDMGAKLVAVGSILYEATKSGFGHYGEAINALHEELSAGQFSGALGDDLFAFG